MNDAHLIAAAIMARRLLKFRYHGFERTFEPHTLGSDHAGAELVCGYQTAGGSSSGQSTGWKFFHIGEISHLTTMDDHFLAPRPEYQKNDRAFANISAQL